MTPCIAALNASGTSPRGCLLRHLAPGPGAWSLKEDLLHAERDGHARPVPKAENERLRDLDGEDLSRRLEHLAPIRVLNGDVVVVGWPRGEVRPLHLVSLVAHETEGQGDLAVVPEVLQDLRRSTLGNEERKRLAVVVHHGADHDGVGGAELGVPRPYHHDRGTVEDLDDSFGNHAGGWSGYRARSQ